MIAVNMIYFFRREFRWCRDFFGAVPRRSTQLEDDLFFDMYWVVGSS